jgi:2-haloacid dehalogenase
MKTSVIFDFGGVLIDWNPRHLYRKVFEDEQAMEDFLANVCNDAWQEKQNETRGWAEAVEERVALFPEQRPLIEMYRDRWPEMLGDADWDTFAILDALRRRDVPLYGLTNWSMEMFPHARRKFAFIGWFEVVVVSGEVGIRKPSPEIFRYLF